MKTKDYNLWIKKDKIVIRDGNKVLVFTKTKQTNHSFKENKIFIPSDIIRNMKTTLIQEKIFSFFRYPKILLNIEFGNNDYIRGVIPRWYYEN